MSRVLLVGELNPYGGPESNALVPWPDGCAGHRLQQILGLTEAQYLALHRMNLCRGAWSMREARRRAQLVYTAEPSRPWDVIVLLGAKVATAFAYPGLAFSSDVDRMPPGAQGTMPSRVYLPHPSGLCRRWHEPGAVDRARAILMAVAPQVPWGEAT